MSEKAITILLLIAGAAAVAYGMLTENNYVFIAGYCLVRRDLKRWVEKRKGSEDRG